MNNKNKLDYIVTTLKDKDKLNKKKSYIENSLLEEEVNSRNFVLFKLYGKIPPYCLWDISDISFEQKNEKIKFWKDFIESESILIKSISNYWINYHLIK